MTQNSPTDVNINTLTQRWYDESFVKSIIEAYKLVPDHQKDQMANRINDLVDGIFKNSFDHKVNTSHHMNLGRFKEFHKRRWYDRNPNILKAVKNLHSLINQPRDFQKKAMVGLVGLLGDYIKMLKTEDDPLERPLPPPEIQEEPVIEETIEKPVEEHEEEEPQDPKKSKIMVSGEKLSLKRETPLKKRKKVNKT